MALRCRMASRAAALDCLAVTASQAQAVSCGVTDVTTHAVPGYAVWSDGKTCAHCGARPRTDAAGLLRSHRCAPALTYGGLPRDFGFPQPEPQGVISPVTCTGGDLCPASDGQASHLLLTSSLDGRSVGRAKAGCDPVWTCPQRFSDTGGQSTFGVIERRAKLG